MNANEAALRVQAAEQQLEIEARMEVLRRVMIENTNLRAEIAVLNRRVEAMIALGNETERASNQADIEELLKALV